MKWTGRGSCSGSGGSRSSKVCSSCPPPAVEAWRAHRDPELQDRICGATRASLPPPGSKPGGSRRSGSGKVLRRRHASSEQQALPFCRGRSSVSCGCALQGLVTLFKSSPGPGCSCSQPGGAAGRTGPPPAGQSGRQEASSQLGGLASRLQGLAWALDQGSKV
eukprot:13783362-Heterocapsa_arctica.AAC.1